MKLTDENIHFIEVIERGLSTRGEHRNGGSIAETALAAVSPGHATRGLTPEYQLWQSELRNSFKGVNTSGIGEVFPFYAKRGMTASGTTTTAGDQGGQILGTDVPEIGAAFRAAFVLEQLGARVFGGLRNNVNFPRAKTGLAASWLSETATESEATELFASLDLVPQRVSAFLTVSLQLLAQQRNVEAFLRTELTAAIASEVQRVLIAGSGSGAEPLGILGTAGIGSVVGGTNGAVPTYANVTALEYAVTGAAKADRGHCAWLCSPLVRQKLRNVFVNGTGSGPVWQQDQAYSLLGHPAGVTVSSPDTLTKGSASGICSAILFGEMSELFVGLWGDGVIVEAIPTGGGKTGNILLIATAFANGGLRSPEAFAVMPDALCQ